MAEILTTNFKTDTTRLFVDDIVSNEYYLFVSEMEQESAENSIRSKNNFLENVIFGKKIRNDDVKFMIKYYPWQRDSVYEQYDDNIDLENSNFYAVVGPTNHNTGDYRVYKCLDNNDGAESKSAPQYDASISDQIYRTADGYVWKFMYALSRIQFDAYNALGYIPIVGNFNSDPVANTGGSEITTITVENEISNAGYRVAQGSFFGQPTDSSTGALQGNIRVTFSELYPFSKTVGYYVGQTLYAVGPGVAELYTILAYTYDDNTNTGRFTVQGRPRSDGLGSNATCQIFPRIKIDGDGTGAAALPTFVDGTLTNVDMLSVGSGYNNAEATVIDPIYDFDPDSTNTTDVRAEIRVVLSPPDGHNTNLLDELYCRHFLFYSYITAAQNNLIRINNVYSKVGIVKNPVFIDPDAGTTTTYTVTVASGENNYGTGNKYYLDGELSPTLELVEGRTYRFDQSDSSNSTHPLRFSTTPNGSFGGGTEYTTGVTTVGTPGNAGAYVEIALEEGAPTLHYYCTAHSGMGGQLNTDLYSVNNSPEIFDNTIAVVTDDIGGLEKNEIVYQYSGGNNIVFQGTVYELDLQSNTAYIAIYNGPRPPYSGSNSPFNPTLDLRKSNGQIIRINTPVEDNVTESPYAQRTGKVYFMEDFFPLERTVNSREEFKFVMEF